MITLVTRGRRSRAWGWDWEGAGALRPVNPREENPGGRGLLGGGSASDVQGPRALDWQGGGQAIQAEGPVKGQRTNPSAASGDGASFHPVAGEGR